MKDLFGKAILDYQTGNNPQDLITETSISEADEMSVAYLFRGFEKMPKMEQNALLLSNGKVLDVGCGAGSHSLYLQEKGYDVTPIDISPNAIKACQLRGLKKATVKDVMSMKVEQFDTILLLMNGAGMCGRLKNISRFLLQLKSLLTENGQILVDSSDIIYMFDEDEDGGKWIPGDTDYYGELEFKISYKGEMEKPFDWMYIDFNTLQNAALANGLACELLVEGDHFDYLARLSHQKIT
ncbi:class I SAM-dependent methyltransferase [Flavobacterium sp.]|uniref:class I SAM-dependent methyltransferase n=1 Tax=Flavobacterium sp. TaxID=239 RepID=UPI0025C4B80A|nr:class I SAM-dependent methyltransferase [Flavobacterium sp.]MBA4153907.1 SAM-dependent methyltransferase [Flavobacterium sp.]